MCTFCIEIIKQNMTPIEVARAFLETTFEKEHWYEVIKTINENYDGDEVNKQILEIHEESKF